MNIAQAIIPAMGFGVIGAIGFRGAGGLFSQWAKHDLGNFMPRQVWGLAATLPIIPIAIASPWIWYVKAPLLILTSVLTGVMRGSGWGNSLSLGYAAPKSKPDDTHEHKFFVMVIHLLMMLALPLISLIVFFMSLRLSCSVEVHFLYGLALYSLMVNVPILSSIGYDLAWQLGPLNIPFLGCTRNDPPPTGELATGFITAFAIALISLTA